MGLLDTSAKEVEIFWVYLSLAKETDPGMYGIIMMKGISYLLEILSFLALFFLCELPGSLVPYCMKWYINEDMMPFGGEYVMIWKEF